MYIVYINLKIVSISKYTLECLLPDIGLMNNFDLYLFVPNSFINFVEVLTRRR